LEIIRKINPKILKINEKVFKGELKLYLVNYKKVDKRSLNKIDSVILIKIKKLSLIIF
jgi:hypothetical protein